MHTKPGFTLRSMMGQNILVAEGAEQARFDKIVSFNDSAALLWRSVEGRDFSVTDMADILVNEYGIPAEQALNDARYVADKWIAQGLASSD